MDVGFRNLTEDNVVGMALCGGDKLSSVALRCQ